MMMRSSENFLSSTEHAAAERCDRPCITDLQYCTCTAVLHVDLRMMDGRCCEAGLLLLRGGVG
jgi:hypothetical protein